MSDKDFVSSKNFVDELVNNNYEFFTGVPCSILKKLIAYFSEHPEYNYIPATREDAAVGLCSGSYMAGKLPVLMMQNSGLGYCLNALTSLNLIYKIPILMLVSWRGFEGKDAPEHIVMGDICADLCRVSGIPYHVFEPSKMETQLKTVTEEMLMKKIPVVLFIKKGTIK